MKKHIQNMFKSLDNEEIVLAFMESKDEFTKSILLKMVLKRKLDFDVWHKLYLHERAKHRFCPGSRNIFFYKMAKAARLFVDYQEICDCFGNADSWRCIRIDKNYYKFLQKSAYYFGECEIVCKAAILRRDFKTANIFMHRMFDRSLSYAQYWSVSCFYREIRRGNRDYKFEGLLIKKMNETALSFDDLCGVCRLSNKYNLGYGKSAFDTLLKSEEAKTIECQEHIYYAINSYYCFNGLPIELEWVNEANAVLVGNMSNMANSYDDWKIVLEVSDYFRSDIKWSSVYVELSIENMVESLTKAQPEYEFRKCCDLTVKIKNQVLLKKVLCKYLDIYGYDQDVITYVAKVSESILGKKLKPSFLNV